MPNQSEPRALYLHSVCPIRSSIILLKTIAFMLNQQFCFTSGFDTSMWFCFTTFPFILRDIEDAAVVGLFKF